eukprot:51063-Eustigmatos_ZCMA.PRE.1
MPAQLQVVGRGAMPEALNELRVKRVRGPLAPISAHPAMAGLSPRVIRGSVICCICVVLITAYHSRATGGTHSAGALRTGLASVAPNISVCNRLPVTTLDRHEDVTGGEKPVHVRVGKAVDLSHEQEALQSVEELHGYPCAV